MEQLFNEFITERRFLRNLSETTLGFYEETFRYFNQVEAFPPSKESLQKAVIALRKRGVSVGGVNTYLRGLNTFLRWLKDERDYPDLTIKLLKNEKPVLPSLTDDEIKRLIAYKPQDRYEVRLHNMILTLLDTGIRINECITLKRESVDMDNMLLTVLGKGNKERIVPFSYELRKVLFKQLKHKHPWVFPTRDGGKLTYCNVLRDYAVLTKRLKIKTEGNAFHQLRRTFATSFIRSGGNPYTLQRILGHSDMSQTSQYVKLVTDDLSVAQHKNSLLNRLR